MKKEEFKEFVKANPHLLEYINNNQMTWQKFYEIYDMYGTDETIWSKYKSLSTNNVANTSNSPISSITDILNIVKKLDLETVRKSIEGVSKAVSIIQDLTNKKDEISPKDVYEPRPI
ncbi:MAG: spore coat protein YlbD, partial [Bacilli bacterium]